MAIDGVLIHLKDSDHKGAEKYDHHLVTPATFTSCPYIWRTPLRLGLYLCITYTQYPPPIHNPRNGYEFFFYTKDNPMVASPFVLFRNDLKQLHPKQVQALWKFLKHLIKKFTPAVPSPDITERWAGSPADLARDDHSNRFWTLGAFWKEYCTMNNFSAFFNRLRYRKLMTGDESWRIVKSPYDV